MGVRNKNIYTNFANGYRLREIAHAQWRFGLERHFGADISKWLEIRTWSQQQFSHVLTDICIDWHIENSKNCKNVILMGTTLTPFLHGVDDTGLLPILLLQQQLLLLHSEEINYRWNRRTSHWHSLDNGADKLIIDPVSDRASIHRLAVLQYRQLVCWLGRFIC